MMTTALLLAVPAIVVVLLAQIAKVLISRRTWTSQASSLASLRAIETPPVSDVAAPAPIAGQIHEGVGQASQAA
jgi:hypothetical protein